MEPISISDSEEEDAPRPIEISDSDDDSDVIVMAPTGTVVDDEVMLTPDELDRKLCEEYIKKSGKREDHKDLFVKGNDMRVLFVSTAAGGAGLNLQKADCVIFIDQVWSDAIAEQAKRRVDRPVRTRPARIYSMLTEGTAEDRALEVRKNKAAQWQRVREGRMPVMDTDAPNDDDALVAAVLGKAATPKKKKKKTKSQ